MTHGLFTDAVTRFTKGQSPLQCLPVLAKTVESIKHDANGKVAGPVVDNNCVNKTILERGSLYEPVKVTTDFINVRLGLELSADEMKKLLENVEFQIEVTGDELIIKAPFWRTDIELREDIVEEIGRLYGYDHLPLKLPKRDLTPAPRNSLLEAKSKTRDHLAKAGANEVLTYSFVHGDLLEKVGQDKLQAFQVSNALSPDLQYYRLSLTPSLLEKVHPNIKAGHDEFALFEIGKAHVIGEADHEDTNVPKEVNALSFIYAAKDSQASAPYYIAKKYLMNLLSGFQLWQTVKFEPSMNADLYKNPWVEQMTAPFEPQRSAVLRGKEGLIWGVVGEFKLSVRRALKLPAVTAGFEIDPLLLQGDVNGGQQYVPLPRFPKVTQDVTLKVPADLSYQDLFDFASQELGKVQPKNTLPNLSPRDIFQREDDEGHKQITFRLEIASYNRTLTDPEVNKLLDTIATAAKTKYGAERI
jgi:phenylalanyl-tRNA synthetase beta chain